MKVTCAYVVQRDARALHLSCLGLDASQKLNIQHNTFTIGVRCEETPCRENPRESLKEMVCDEKGRRILVHKVHKHMDCRLCKGNTPSIGFFFGIIKSNVWMFGCFAEA
jgi:hypothetical protein